LRALGSSAVGMSTAAEFLRARELGMRAAAVSCITNNCCAPGVLTHEHVLRTASAASARLCGLLRGAIAREAARCADGPEIDARAEGEIPRFAQNNVKEETGA
jgi:purine-nucleoside phosphorylase